MNVPTIKALLLDTFGTVMNWRDSIIDDFRSFGRRIGVEVDWEAFVHDWKTAYRPGMDAVRTGKWPWTRVDRIYRTKLDEMLPKYGLDQLSEEERANLNRVWKRPVNILSKIDGKGKLLRFDGRDHSEKNAESPAR